MFKRQIPIRDKSIARNLITMARFARQVGKTVNAFLQVRLSTPLNDTVCQLGFTFKDCELDPGCVDDRHKLWRIGQGGVQRSDIIIIGAVHVSAGSWMPIMQLNRYIF